MAIQVSGTTVISNNRALSSVNGLKTIGGVSILGSGDISAGGGTETVVIPAGDWTNTNQSGNNSLSGGTNGRWGFMSVLLTGTSNNNFTSLTCTTNSTNGHFIISGYSFTSTNRTMPNSIIGAGSTNLQGGFNGDEGYYTYRFKIDASANIAFSGYPTTFKVTYIDL